MSCAARLTGQLHTRRAISGAVRNRWIVMRRPSRASTVRPYRLLVPVQRLIPISRHACGLHSGHLQLPGDAGSCNDYWNASG